MGKNYRANSFTPNTSAVVMYVDMNSFFASCEQQDVEHLRNKPIGVITHPSPTACVIAPSVEAKKFGVKTGMRLPDCQQLCPHIIPVLARPFRYRQYHIMIMEVLRKYCDDVLPKSIDEAVMNLTSYKLVYKDFFDLARKIKDDIKAKCGEYVKCSIGIAPNAFLAKLGTELQKPDGLIRITPENIDEYLQRLQLTDLPGIGSRNERRLKLLGINTPLQMRHSSEALLRKVFGGIVGNYWYHRLNFVESDLYQNAYRAMSAGRTVSREQRESRPTLESLLIALLTRLEQRMVKQRVFCRALGFTVRYKDGTSWDTLVKFSDPTQDAMEMRSYLLHNMQAFEQSHRVALLSNKTQHMVVVVSNFVIDKFMQYGLFDNRMRQDKARKAMYVIKDKYGRDIVRRASETVAPDVMRDAIGFGSVKDLYDGGQTRLNEYLLQE